MKKKHSIRITTRIKASHEIAKLLGISRDIEKQLLEIVRKHTEYRKER